MADITQILAQNGVNTHAVATQAFGNAVESFAAGPLNAAMKNAFSTTNSAPTNRTGSDGVWYGTSYGHSMANSAYRPKLKFLFRVEFLFKPNALAQFGQSAAKWKDQFTFMIKEIDRPKVDFEYEEVNQYNFRTKILKSIKHQPLNISFLDDVGNNVYEFFRFMMMVQSPITRRSIGASFNIADEYAAYTAGSGMTFSDSPNSVTDFAHRGVTGGAKGVDVGNVIQAIKITQIFVQPGAGKSGSLDTSPKEIAFFFVNPRVESFDLDNLDHEPSEFSTMSMKFDFDFMVMSDMRTLQKLGTGVGMPSVSSAPGEISPTGNAGSNSSSAQGAANPYTNLLAAAGSRAAASIVSTAVGTQIRKVPGLGSVADTMSGLVQGSVSDRINGIASTVNQSFARPSRAVVSDSTVPSNVPGIITTSTGTLGVGQPDIG